MEEENNDIIEINAIEEITQDSLRKLPYGEKLKALSIRAEWLKKQRKIDRRTSINLLQKRYKFMLKTKYPDMFKARRRTYNRNRNSIKKQENGSEANKNENKIK